MTRGFRKELPVLTQSTPDQPSSSDACSSARMGDNRLLNLIEQWHPKLPEDARQAQKEEAEELDDDMRNGRPREYQPQPRGECHGAGVPCDGHTILHEGCSRYASPRVSRCPLSSSAAAQDGAIDAESPNISHRFIPDEQLTSQQRDQRALQSERPVTWAHKCSEQRKEDDGKRLGTPAKRQSSNRGGQVDVKAYAEPFISFISKNPTVFHAVAHLCKQLESKGFTKLSERESWTNTLSRGGKYFFERNGSSIIAFEVGSKYESGNGASVIASHIDALTTRLKPIPTLSSKAGYVQLGVAPYAGALNNTWWDRDLGIGGRVLVKNNDTGKIETRLVKLGWPIARIPTLAPHFGAAANLSNPNKETQMVPIIGLDHTDPSRQASNEHRNPSVLGGAGTFAATQPERLVKAIAGELSIQDYSTIVNWELELFDTQPAQLGGLEKEFIFAGRVDDKLCSFAAIEALLASSQSEDSSTIKIVGCFDDEEIGSLLRQGAHSNLLPSALERICEAFSEKSCGVNTMSQMYANSFLISADVSHAVNPNFLDAYLENHSPRLNTGIAVQADPNGHTTTDSISTAFLQRIADKCEATLQVFQIRNDSRSGGTVGPMLSSAMGMRAIDAGVAQLSMHSIRATIGSLDPGLGVKLFKGFFDHFEEVDAEFR